MKTLDQIAAELQGYDPQALSADAVGLFLSRLVEPVLESETVGIFEALGRVLAADVVSPLNVPPHDNSAMDGYAFAGDSLVAGQALNLKLVGTALAGRAWRGLVGAGECVKIMTGAVMPAGLDTVAPQELVSVSADADATPTIHIPPDRITSGDNRRHLGEDILQGQVALAQGLRLGPAALGLLASLGIGQVQVLRRLKVGYFSTGDEILSLGEPPREGAVYDSNRYTVYGLLTRLGAQVIDLGVVPDEPAALEAAFQQAAQQADAIITSGGVSVGEADHTKAMMKKLCADSGGVAFWRIAMRPGRPMAVGRISPDFGTKTGDSPRGTSVTSYSKNSIVDSGRGAILFGLPGNPVAVMVTFLAFVRPALLQMMGSQETAAPLLQARSREAIHKRPGRTEYQRGIVSLSEDGAFQVHVTGNQGSGVLSSMTQANGLIVLHHDQGNVAAGDSVAVMMFEGAI